MIPKKIHYCWFGGKPLDSLGERCKKSWEKYFPDYEIIEWNESNFDVNSCDYTKEAYENEKWAFVSDYARFKILFEHGGIYFDTDVEVIKSFDPIVEKGGFLGAESFCCVKEMNHEKKVLLVNPGLAMGAEKGIPLYREILNHYESAHFLLKDGSLDLTTVVKRTTDLLETYGLKPEPIVQRVFGVWIYPPEYFNPMGTVSGKETSNTYSKHHYAGSWCTDSEKRHKKMYRLVRKCLGKKIAAKLLVFFRIICKINHNRMSK